MSPAVGNFVHDLVEMAKAMETLPQIEEQARQLQAKLDQAQAHNAGLEENIIGYKQKIEDLQSKVRSLEVERDDASFRVLEAEDKAHNVLAMAKAAQVSLEQMTKLLDPPKPEPVKEPEKVEMPEGHQATAVPIGATQDQSESPPTEKASSEVSGSTFPIPTEGQHELIHPTSPSHDYDPEPTPKWSYEWYQWNDRRNERAAKQASAF